MEYDKVLLKVTVVMGAVGGFLLGQLGGWDNSLYALISLMAVDYLLGICLGCYGRSTKTATGKLSSTAGAKGLIKKTAVLLCVYVGCILDRLTGVDVVRDGIIIAFCGTETISIIENLTGLGIPIPQVLKKFLDNFKEVKDDDR